MFTVILRRASLRKQEKTRKVSLAVTQDKYIAPLGVGERLV
jgi:hypothetical protein